MQGGFSGILVAGGAPPSFISPLWVECLLDDEIWSMDGLVILHFIHSDGSFRPHVVGPGFVWGYEWRLVPLLRSQAPIASSVIYIKDTQPSLS